MFDSDIVVELDCCCSSSFKDRNEEKNVVSLIEMKLDILNDKVFDRNKFKSKVIVELCSFYLKVVKFVDNCSKDFERDDSKLRMIVELCFSNLRNDEFVKYDSKVLCVFNVCLFDDEAFLKSCIFFCCLFEFWINCCITFCNISTLFSYRCVKYFCFTNLTWRILFSAFNFENFFSSSIAFRSCENFWFES
jgi:uncharacterized protein YfkK (UPF0435 family)